MPEEKPLIETITLPTGGSIPGIPGQHGPGSYIINWHDRTITSVAEAGSPTIAFTLNWKDRTIATDGAIEPQTSESQE